MFLSRSGLYQHIDQHELLTLESTKNHSLHQHACSCSRNFCSVCSHTHIHIHIHRERELEAENTFSPSFLLSHKAADFWPAGRVFISAGSGGRPLCSASHYSALPFPFPPQARCHFRQRHSFLESTGHRWLKNSIESSSTAPVALK